MTATVAPRSLLVGADVGGSKIAVLVAGHDLAVRSRLTLPTELGSPELASGIIAAAIGRAVDDAGAGLGAVAGVGVGVPGRVDPEAGTVSLAVNLGWSELPLGRELARRLGSPVAVENDVRAAAAGLYARRVLGDVRHLAYLSVGTGISAGVVLDGRLYRGSRGLAGEIGHLVIDRTGPRCACGLHGCLEALAAGPAIARRAAEAMAAGRSSVLADAGRAATPADVYAAAGGGDPLAREIADEVGAHLARAVHELVMAYDVEVVVLGGGVAGAGDAFLDPILRALDRLRDASPLAREVLRPGVVHLLPAGADAGAWGALALARDAAGDGLAPVAGREVSDG